MDESFEERRRGSLVARFAIIAGFIIIASTFAGATVEQMARAGNLPSIALLEPNQYVATKNSEPVGIDFTPTGSISGRVRLSPCALQPTAP
jgi:hypothetical protein